MLQGDILSTQTLTSAEAYHNLAWEMRHHQEVPVGAIGVQARFSGEVDASTVKHRLDVLYEVPRLRSTDTAHAASRAAARRVCAA